MELENIIVGHAQIAKAIGGSRHESVLESTESRIVVAAGGDQLRAAKFMISLAGGLKALSLEETSPVLLSSPQHQVGSLLQSFIASRAAEEGKLEPLPRDLGLEVRFDEQDWVGWVGSFFSWSEKFLRGKFQPPPVQPVTEVGNDISIAVLADWGTGLYGAPESAKSIQKNKADIILHLGDVYYAGTSGEERSRFLKYWPSVSGTKNYSLNSNHEMYTGGHGYMETLLQDPRFSQCQKSNYFAIRNDHFILLCLDTAYEEHKLTNDELIWLLNNVQNADGRKVIVFSHHQPFSIFDVDNASGEILSSMVASLLTDRKIFAWYWGHEHRCIVYDRHPIFGLYGRCIGHGGYPHFRSQTPGLPTSCPSQSTFIRFAGHGGPGALVLDGPNPYILGQEAEYAPHGYLTLNFTGTTLGENLHDPDGHVIFENALL